MANCKIQESKKKARRFINCMLLGRMMIYGIELLDKVAKLGKDVNESSLITVNQNLVQQNPCLPHPVKMFLCPLQSYWGGLMTNFQVNQMSV